MERHRPRRAEHRYRRVEAKTATRRVVPIADNLAAWLAPYVERQGKVWRGTHDDFYRTEQATAAATAVEADP